MVRLHQGEPSTWSGLEAAQQAQMPREEESSQKPLTRRLLPSDGASKRHSEVALPLRSGKGEEPYPLSLRGPGKEQGRGPGTRGSFQSGVPARRSEGAGLRAHCHSPPWGCNSDVPQEN